MTAIDLLPFALSKKQKKKRKIASNINMSPLLLMIKMGARDA